MNAARMLMKHIGTDVYSDFNEFEEMVDDLLKEKDIKLNASEKRILFDAVTWYDSEAEKVIKKTTKLTGKKLEKLLGHLDCTKEELARFWLLPTDKDGVYIEYDTCNRSAGYRKRTTERGHSRLLFTGSEASCGGSVDRSR
ncbi:MAG: hypothetical protein U5K71_15740 [Gracilimonas sp.]|nr:hypothetical protein [Gracilimonas sp.]